MLWEHKKKAAPNNAWVSTVPVHLAETSRPRGPQPGRCDRAQGVAAGCKAMGRGQSSGRRGGTRAIEQAGPPRGLARSWRRRRSGGSVEVFSRRGGPGAPTREVGNAQWQPQLDAGGLVLRFWWEDARSCMLWSAAVAQLQSLHTCVPARGMSWMRLKVCDQVADPGAKCFHGRKQDVADPGAKCFRGSKQDPGATCFRWCLLQVSWQGLACVPRWVASVPDHALWKLWRVCCLWCALVRLCWGMRVQGRRFGWLSCKKTNTCH